MAMNFDTEDRPHIDVINALREGETPFKKVPFPETGNDDQTFEEVLASDRYRQVINTLHQYVGEHTPIMNGDRNIVPLQMSMMNAYHAINGIEVRYRRELEQLAVRLVLKELGIPEGELEIEATIVGADQIDMNDFNRDEPGEENNEPPIQPDKNEYTEVELMSLEKAKRRLINSIIQGSSARGHYMYHLVNDEIVAITRSRQLVELYGHMMSINDVMYWQLGDQTMDDMAGSGAGKEEVDSSEETVKIKVQGINFPVLVHELIKAILEVVAIHGRSEDQDTFTEVEQSEDTLDKEMWDLRLGPVIWNRLRDFFPIETITDDDKKGIQVYILQFIFKLPAKEFLVFMKEILEGSEVGKELMDDLLNEIDTMFEDEEYEEHVEYEEEDDDEIPEKLKTLTDETNEDDLSNFYKNIFNVIPKKDGGSEVIEELTK